MGKNSRETLNEQLQNSEFKAEWEALKTERHITLCGQALKLGILL